MPEDKKIEITGDNGNGLKEKAEEKVEEKKEQQTPPEIKDFKIAEIWIRNGRLMLDASKEFWLDKFRARGMLKYCDEIVRDAEYREDKPLVQKANWANFKNFVRGIKRRR